VVDNLRQRNLDIVRRAFAGIALGSAEKMLVDNYTDDMVLELPYASPPSTIEGKATALKYLTAAFGMFRFSLEITAVHECVDPNLLVLEYTSVGKVLASGKPYANQYIGVYWFRDGRIARVREFYNPVISADALS
jgi:ketosteroid isomerase-like protein